MLATYQGATAAEWTKLKSLRSTWWTLAAMVGSSIGLAAITCGVVAAHWATATPADKAGWDPTNQSLSGTLTAQIAIAVLGVLAITAEMSTGTIKASVMAVPHRTPLEPQGPPVLPGVYRVRLTVDGQSETQSLTVKMDPRVHTSPAELAILHNAEEAMASALTNIAKADLAAHSVQEQLNDPENAPFAAQLALYTEELNKLIQGSGERGEQPLNSLPGLDKVNSDAAGLYGELDQSDQPPTTAQLDTSKQIEHDVDEVTPLWQLFEKKQLPVIDHILEKHRRPAVNPDKAPANMPVTGDED